MDQTRKDKLRLILQSIDLPADHSSQSAAQDTYIKRLREDMERTRTFLRQATEANGLLENEVSGENWDESSKRQAHLVALYEAYKKLPYMAMKNDLIGIATAASLTKKAVAEQRQASAEIANENAEIEEATVLQSQLLADYTEINDLLNQRILAHPDSMNKLRKKLDESQPLEVELASKLESVQNATASMKSVEDRMYQHVKRVVTKLYALQDWENASVMDEKTFKTSIRLALSLIVRLVTNLLSPQEKWIAAPVGGPEEKLLLVMMRNNLVVVRGNEVRLRDYGFEEWS